MESTKQINIKNRTYYLFNDIDMINIKNVDSNLPKIDKKSYKYIEIDIYHIDYVTMKNLDYVNIHSVNPLYLIFNKVHRYIEKSNENKYLTFAPTYKNNEILTKYTEPWNKIKNLIEKINGKPCKCKKEFIKIKFDSDGDLPLNKILKLHNLTIVVESAFQEDKYYPQIFLNECLYEL